jgi:hypothetical protein
MNAPPGFLEFLLCIPWCNLPHMHPANAANTNGAGSPSSTAPAKSTSSSKASSGSSRKRSSKSSKAGGAGSSGPGGSSNEQLLNQLQVDEAERRLLVNTRIHPALMTPLLDFLYQPEHADSVPLGLQLTPAAGTAQSRSGEVSISGWEAWGLCRELINPMDLHLQCGAC